MNIELPQIVLARAAFSGLLEYLAEVKRQKDAGTWDPATAAYAEEGAGEYVDAIRRGDLAPKDAVAVRDATCRGCPTRVPHPTHPGTRLGFCGPAFVDRTKEAVAPSCGCPQSVAILVASKGCVQGRYPPVARVGG